MHSLLAKRAFPYAGRSIVAGEIFEPASVNDAKALIMAGHAELITDPADPSDADSSDESESLPTKRLYRRRAKAEPLAD